MIRAVLLFGAGYVLGTKAGQERYEQIQKAAKKVTQELEKRAGGTSQPRRSS